MACFLLCKPLWVCRLGRADLGTRAREQPLCREAGKSIGESPDFFYPFWDSAMCFFVASEEPIDSSVQPVQTA